MEVENFCLQIKRHQPHMIILSMDFTDSNTILAEALKANLTTANGWLWLTIDTMAMLGFDELPVNHMTHQMKGMSYCTCAVQPTYGT